MRATMKCLSGLLVACVAVFPFVEANCAPCAKILSVDTQKVFERYNEAQEAQAAYGEAVAAADKELKEMHEEVEKLGEKVNALREKSENTTFTEAAREKYRKEAEEKEELLRIKADEFYRRRQSMNDDLVKRRNEEVSEHIKAINEAVADVAKSKKADIVLSKATGTVYVDPLLDITDDVIKFLNEDDDNSRTSSSNFNNRRR